MEGVLLRMRKVLSSRRAVTLSDGRNLAGACGINDWMNRIVLYMHKVLLSRWTTLLNTRNLDGLFRKSRGLNRASQNALHVFIIGRIIVVVVLAIVVLALTVGLNWELKDESPPMLVIVVIDLRRITITSS